MTKRVTPVERNTLWILCFNLFNFNVHYIEQKIHVCKTEPHCDGKHATVCPSLNICYFVYLGIGQV